MPVRFVSWAANVLLGYALVVALMPLMPVMPASGLDPSWTEALNRATAGHLRFGSDIVFTYGPYAGVSTFIYEPALRSLTLFSAAVYTLGWLSAVLTALAGSPVWLRLLAAVAVLTNIADKDVLSLIYPLVAVLAVARLATAEPAAGWRRRTTRLGLLFLLGAPFGLLPLVKLSVLPAVGIGGLVCLYLLLRRRRWLDAAVLVGTAVLTTLLAWWRAGQPMAGLVDYVVSSIPVINGYGPAMSVMELSRFPHLVAPGTYVGGALVLLVLAALAARDAVRRALWVMLAAMAFLVFKASFVRPDAHMRMGTILLLILGTVAVAWTGRRTVRAIAVQAVTVLVVLASAGLVYFSPMAPLPDPQNWARHSLHDVPSFVAHGGLSIGRLNARYDEAHAAIRNARTIPDVHGTVDLYPYQLSELFARDDVSWTPRPVIQSYSAYTPELAKLNADHLSSDEAADTLLVQVGPIDGRLAGLDDGASWLPMLEHYDLAGFSRRTSFLRLERRDQPLDLPVGDPIDIHGSLGTPLTLPDTDSAWLASFDVRPTLLGRLRSTAWTPPAMTITVTRADGTIDSRTFIPEMAQSEFVLSPYVVTTADLAALFTDPSGAQEHSRVISLTLAVGGIEGDRFWSGDYSVRLRPLDLSVRAQASPPLGRDRAAQRP